MDIDTSALFTPIVINGHTVKNRIAVAPMTRISATEDGRASETMARYYERFARGGFGAVSTEGTYTDQAFSQGYANQPGISDGMQAEAWKPVIAGIKTHGALAIAQLMHAGALSQGNRFRHGTVGPSAIQPKGEQMVFYHGKDRYAVPEAMTESQIAGAIDGIAQAAERAIALAGFDAIEIHGANGYLLDQFLTDYTNIRTDQWGGTTENRLRLILETFKAVRKKVGAKVPVGVRISQGKVNDYQHKWAAAERDAEFIFGRLGEAGVDFVHVTEYTAWQPAFTPGGPSLMHLAKRYAPKAAILANGGLHNIAQAVAALNDGADIVTIARGALANPDLPKRLSDRRALSDFDPAILGPIANIKETELAM
ncbi:MAG: NADH:flavin oxidoreductase [Acidiphilium sp. 37-64-53]|uniref:NADH:flavin oxidoreductase n=1 Tax=unclassified Acidiphilium TaxID=2617493 RepID=UPI000BDB45E3|nr:MULTISPECIES: NADH:flavin oxidoreductase [unclassified Acidiphilium]OYV99868.1 MAG: NADH:flavin oxidoreductase [Acidiphilium sp. 37-64-53]OZB22880.1 MAG: NADH:flavin oxidoreductase [Acidiphilium sp. 34-64-41]HQT90048.1 NADH:flavin oxidoreductase [Acidiphilium sp.]